MNSWLLLCPLLLPLQGSRSDDLAGAREVFERNIAAIQQRDREAYLGCYFESPELVRTGPEGMQLGWAGLAESASASGSDEWPTELVARDLRLQWLADGWVYGTYRYQVDFAGSLQEGISERLFRKTEDGWRIVITTAFEAKGEVPAAPLALVGATLYDGDGGQPLADSVIVTRGGRIETVGARASTPIPDGVEVIDLSGKFVTPGLVDTHVHYSQTGWVDGRPDARDMRETHPYEKVVAELEGNPERFHRAFLACGVTAVFDNGGYPWTRRLADRAESSPQAPHVAAAGPLLTTWIPDVLMLPDRQQFVLMEDEEGVRAAVRNHVAAGSDAIKVWFISRGAEDVARMSSLVRAAGDEARSAGLPLIVHATELETARAALEAGAHLLVHSVDDMAVDEDFIEKARASGTFYCPTLTVSRGYFHVYGAEVPASVSSELQWVHPSIRERVLSTEDLDREQRFDDDVLARIDWNMTRQESLMAENLIMLHEAGVPIVLGTDAGNPLTLHGPSVFAELEAMQAAGLTGSQVITAATRDAARAMGRGNDIGLVRAGRLADLLVLDSDPGIDVTAFRALGHVMRAGTLHSRDALRPR